MESSPAVAPASFLLIGLIWLKRAQMGALLDDGSPRIQTCNLGDPAAFWGLVKSHHAQ